MSKPKKPKYKALAEANQRAATIVSAATRVIAKRKKSKKPKRVNWKKAALALASCAVFTIKNRRSLGGSGYLFDFKTGKTGGPWQDKFFDALDAVGYVVDREAYYARQSRSEKRRRQP